jgi:membrane fusion protein, copper/silver efflux system
MNDPDSLHTSADAGDPLMGRRSTIRDRLWKAAGFVQVRARFLIVLAVIGLVVGQWERLTGYWNWLVRQAAGDLAGPSAVSSDTEFFCPMDPGVVSPWEDKCPICNMTLVRRKKGDAPLLPQGIVARMQISPYRLQLGGIKTAEVKYRPLVKEITAVGFVRRESARQGDTAQEPAHHSTGLLVEVRIAERDLPFLVVGQQAEVRLSIPEAPPAKAQLERLDPQTDSPTGSSVAQFRLTAAGDLWRPGALASVRVRVPLADIEPYRSLSREPPPLRADEPRTAYISRGHPEVIRDRPGLCPLDKTELVAVPLAGNQRLNWWCPMHPEVTALEDGHACQKCGGMKLLPQIVSYAPAGEVLAVPQEAVIDTGRQQLVFVEVAPGMLEGQVVRLGSRAGEFFPVLEGLSPGKRVVSSGAFLLDAETRLSAQASTAYFGAGAAGGNRNP